MKHAFGVDLRRDKVSVQVKKKVEAAEQRLNTLEQRYMGSQFKVLIPPMPISFYSEELPDDGVVARFIFPVSGRIVKAAIYVEDKGKVKKLNIAAEVISPGIGQAFTFNMGANQGLVDLEVPVVAGQKLKISLTNQPNDPIDRSKKIWVGVLFEVSIENQEIKKFAISELEAESARIHGDL